MTDTHCGSFMLHLVQGSTFRWTFSQADLIHFFPLKVYVQIFWHLRQMPYLTVLRQKKTNALDLNEDTSSPTLQAYVPLIEKAPVFQI